MVREWRNIEFSFRSQTGFRSCSFDCADSKTVFRATASVRLSGESISAYLDYVSRTLGYKTDRPYYGLAWDVGEQWQFGSDNSFLAQEEVIRDMGLGRDSMVFHSNRAKELRDIVQEMFMSSEHTRTDLYLNQSLLYRYFSILLDDMEVRFGSRTGRNKIVSEAVQHIEKCYSDPSVRVAEIAKSVNVERGYLYALFMKHLGLSPQEYLLKFRLTKATDLLNHTDYPIDKIASDCGYQDPVTFSKAFRKMFGAPPGKYRKLSREWMKDSKEHFDSLLNEERKVNKN